MPTVSPIPVTISHHPSLPERGHKLFESLAWRVVTQWVYEEAIDARTLRMQEPSEMIRLGLTRGGIEQAAYGFLLLTESCQCFYSYVFVLVQFYR